MSSIGSISVTPPPTASIAGGTVGGLGGAIGLGIVGLGVGAAIAGRHATGDFPGFDIVIGAMLGGAVGATGGGIFGATLGSKYL